MKLAVIGPSFFGYLERLTVLLQKRGISAVHFDERPTNATLGKIFIRFAPRPLKNLAAASRQKIICDAIRLGGFTHALVISPEVFSSSSVKLLRSYGIRVCRYGWDSVQNKPHMGSLDPLMDAIGSFDPEDCRKYGYQLIPLYSESSPEWSETKRDFDIMYCATFHSDRPEWVRKIIQACDRRKWTCKLMLFYHARWLWVIRYGWKPWLLGQVNRFQTHSFTRAEIVEATQRSHVVIDLHHQGQTGLTMRTFEALSLGAVVLTTNHSSISGLPEGLKRRIATLDFKSVEKDIEHALGVSAPPLTADELHFLSVDRFLDQIEKLVFGDR